MRKLIRTLIAGVTLLLLGTASVITAQTIGATTTATTSDPKSTSTPTTTAAAASQVYVATTSSVAASSTDTVYPAASSTPAGSPLATSTPSQPLVCDSAYVADLYNTPSGHLDAGYVLSTTTGPGILAVRSGTQAWADCHDSSGNKYEFKLTSEEYAGLSRPNAQMPEEMASSSARVDLPLPASLPSSADIEPPASQASATSTALSPVAATSSLSPDQSDATSTTGSPSGVAGPSVVLPSAATSSATSTPDSVNESSTTDATTTNS